MQQYQGLADELGLLLATETRSLVRHLETATPYVTPATYRIWNELKRMADVSEQHAQRLSALQESLKLPPRPRPFSPVVANYHYVGIDFLLPKLIEEMRQQIAAYRRAINHAGSDEPVRVELESLLAENEARLKTLEGFHRSLADNPAPAESP